MSANSANFGGGLLLFQDARIASCHRPAKPLTPTRRRGRLLNANQGPCCIPYNCWKATQKLPDKRRKALLIGFQAQGPIASNNLSFYLHLLAPPFKCGTIGKRPPSGERLLPTTASSRAQRGRSATSRRPLQTSFPSIVNFQGRQQPLWHRASSAPGAPAGPFTLGLLEL